MITICRIWKTTTKSKADYSFLLHMIYHLKGQWKHGSSTTTQSVIRWTAEEKIRKTSSGRKKIFCGTRIPLIIRVLKFRTTEDNILFLGTSQECKKVKKNKTNQDLKT